MNDDQYFLANAYFDGELTDDDARIAEADQDVMSEVDRLRSLRAGLRHGDVPSASVRVAALAAAMAEFPSNHAVRTDDVSGSAPRTRLTNGRLHRPSASRYLAVAAAVAAFGAAGLVVAGVIGSGSDDDSGTDLAVSSGETLSQLDDDLARSASATTVAAVLEMEASSEQVLSGSVPAPAADFVEESAATTAASDAPTGAAGTELTEAADPAITASPAFSTPYPTTGGPIESVADQDQTLTTPGELAGLGVLLADLRDAGELGATPETICTFDDASVEIVDEARYRLSDVTRTVLVALVADDIEGHTLAIDPDTCAILVVGP